MSKKNIIVIDGQLLQTDAWDRGMGKYMLQVLHQLSEQSPSDMELTILFNENIESPKERYEDLDYHCPNITQRIVRLPLPSQNEETEDKYIQAIDTYLINEFSDDVQLTFMLTNIFTFDIFAEYPSIYCRKTMIFYDLIPLMQWKQLGGYFPPHLYMARFKRIFEADKIFCISETTRTDLIKTFGILEEKTLNINGGYTAHDLPAKYPVSFDVPERFVLLPTGNLPHKNNHLVFKAFNEVRKKHKGVYLVVTSKFTDHFKKELLDICSERVIFSQNVSEQELQYLYQKANLVVFGSKYEGLGLPVLDAVMYAKPIVASRIPVFEEMTEDAFYFFDVESYISAARAIEQALDHDNFPVKQAHYPKILEKYNWEHVGAAVVSDLATSTVTDYSAVIQVRKIRPKIAVVSTNPGVTDSIARMAEKVFVRLRDDFQLAYFFDGRGMNHKKMERPTFLDHVGVDVFDINHMTIDVYKSFDQVFYLVDKASLDFMITQNMACLPGCVVIDSRLPKSNVIMKALEPSNVDLCYIDIDANDALDKIEHYIRQSVRESSYNEAIQFIKSRKSEDAKQAYLKRVQSK